MRSKKIIVLIVALAILPLAFTWFGSKKKEEPKSQKNKEEQESKGTSVTEAKAIPVLPPMVPSVKPVKPVASYPSVQKIYQPIGSSGTAVPKVPKLAPIVPPAVPAATPSIDRIRQQISDIIRINEDLKMRNRSQIAEIQRISDQARVHQRILADLEAAPQEAKTEFRSSDVGAILKQEKIRMIGDETEKNRQRIDQLKTEEDSKSGRKDES